VIVADSSAWVEYLRHTGSPTHLALRGLLDEDADLAVTEVVVMEVLAGARSAEHAEALRQELLRFPVLALRGLEDYEEAAALARACRAGGETLSAQVDCLVAVPAIQAGAAVLHADRDFEVIARHTGLRLYRP
jgi:predicted nucleic acid-binding protein